MRACYPKIHSCLHIVIGSLCLIIGLIGEQQFVRASDEPISIGSITIDPHTNHRRAVILKGTARNIGIQNGRDTFGQRTCGQTFDLEDGTDTIEVWYIIKCHTAEAAILAEEGAQVIVIATIEAPPKNIRTSSGNDLGVRAMATKIVRIKP